MNKNNDATNGKDGRSDGFNNRYGNRRSSMARMYIPGESFASEANMTDDEDDISVVLGVGRNKSVFKLKDKHIPGECNKEGYEAMYSWSDVEKVGMSSSGDIVKFLDTTVTKELVH